MVDKASAYLDYFGVHCNATKSTYSTTKTGFDPGKKGHHELYVLNLRTGIWTALTAVLPTEAVKYLGIRLPLQQLQRADQSLLCPVLRMATTPAPLKLRGTP